MTGVLLVRDFMSTNVKTVRTDATVKEAVAKMNKFRIGSIIVIEGKRLVGIITERDILERIVEPCMEPIAITAKEIMSSQSYLQVQMSILKMRQGLWLRRKSRN